LCLLIVLAFNLAENGIGWKATMSSSWNSSYRARQDEIALSRQRYRVKSDKQI